MKEGVNYVTLILHYVIYGGLGYETNKDSRGAWR